MNVWKIVFVFRLCDNDIAISLDILLLISIIGAWSLAGPPPNDDATLASHVRRYFISNLASQAGRVGAVLFDDDVKDAQDDQMSVIAIIDTDFHTDVRRVVRWKF